MWRDCRLAFRAVAFLRIQRLRSFRSVAINRNGLNPELPCGDVSLGQLVDRNLDGHVDGLRYSARDKRLHRAHHLEMAEIVNGARARTRLKGTIEHRQMRIGELRRPLDSLMLVEVFDHFL